MESSFKGYRAERRTDERASKRPKSSTTESKRRKNTSASQLRELTASLVKIPSLIILFGISKKCQLGVVDFIKTRKTVFPRRCPNKGSWLASFNTSAVLT